MRSDTHIFLKRNTFFALVYISNVIIALQVFTAQHARSIQKRIQASKTISFPGRQRRPTFCVLFTYPCSWSRETDDLHVQETLLIPSSVLCLCRVLELYLYVIEVGKTRSCARSLPFTFKRKIKMFPHFTCKYQINKIKRYSLVQCLGSSDESPQSLMPSQNRLIGTHLLLLHWYSEIRHLVSFPNNTGNDSGSGISLSNG